MILIPDNTLLAREKIAVSLDFCVQRSIVQYNVPGFFRSSVLWQYNFPCKQTSQFDNMQAVMSVYPLYGLLVTPHGSSQPSCNWRSVGVVNSQHTRMLVYLWHNMIRSIACTQTHTHRVTWPYHWHNLYTFNNTRVWLNALCLQLAAGANHFCSML